jgi:hypothetical protein
MRAASYTRPDGELDVPALHRMSGVPDNILRRWLQEAGEPSLENLRRVAPALGVIMGDLVIAAELMTAEEMGRGDGPREPVRPPSPQERILADDVLSDEDKSALIHMYSTMRQRHGSSEESRRRKRS